MKINLSPQFRDDTLVVVKNGDILTINGEDFDFTPLPEGGEIPHGVVPCEWIVGPVTRVDGEIELTLILPHGPNPSPGVAFPEPLSVSGNGPVEFPTTPEE